MKKGGLQRRSFHERRPSGGDTGRLVVLETHPQAQWERCRFDSGPALHSILNLFLLYSLTAGKDRQHGTARKALKYVRQVRVLPVPTSAGVDGAA